MQEVPGRRKLIRVRSQENQQENQKGLKKTHISAARMLTRQSQQDKNHIP
jgi:hypothetical protein